MKCNIGNIDRIIRTIIAIVLIGVGAMYESIIAGVIGGIVLLTVIFRWCPPYALLGINTGCKAKEE